MSELQFSQTLVENDDSYSKFFSVFIVQGITILFIKHRKIKMETLSYASCTHLLNCMLENEVFVNAKPNNGSSRQEVFENGVLRNFTKFTGRHLWREACNFMKKETLPQVFSCEFCEISKNI